MKLEKPSEQFADLHQAAQGMEEGQDKSDLLALFQCADKLYDRVTTFDAVVAAMKQANRVNNQRVEEQKEWLQKWFIMLHYYEQSVSREKVVELEGRREKIA